MPANPKLSSEVHPGTKRSRLFNSPEYLNIVDYKVSSLYSFKLAVYISFKKKSWAKKSTIIFHILVQNPDIPAHISVLFDRSSLPAAWYPLLDSYFSLLNACIWVVSRSTQLTNLSSLHSTCSSQLTACWSHVAAYRSLLGTRLTGRSLRAIHPPLRQLFFSLLIFIVCCSLHNVSFTLFPFAIDNLWLIKLFDVSWSIFTIRLFGFLSCCSTVATHRTIAQ